MTRDSLSHRLLRACIASVGAILVLCVVSCGGVDSGGTGGSSAVGPISGLGSIIVNGVRFDDSTATITDEDGVSFPRSKLRLGVLAAVEGSAVTARGTEKVATASRIRVSSDLIGAVQAVDRSGRTAQVLGQSVRVTAATVFDDLLPLGLDSLIPGVVVEVYGRQDLATAQYVATRIELRSSAAYDLIRGRVDSVDAAGRTVRVGTATIDTASLSSAELALLSAGQAARIRLQPGTLRALAAAGGDRTLVDSPQSFLEGRISRFDSIGRFEVDGQRVDATQASISPAGASLGLGVRVSIEGASRAGVLVAQSVAVEADEDKSPLRFELHGLIESIDTVARTLQLVGVSVDYSGPVTFSNGSATDLAIGRQIEVKGMLQSDGVGLRAEEIKFETN
jgi:hypothetical protein